ncbi:MAG: PKD domain-containing protein [Bacteroidota bacterium]|nr:PKD domain-containing protein [Bacteroidota bacterium]
MKQLFPKVTVKHSAYLLLLFIVIFNTAGHAQVFWTENFNNGCTANCPATTYVGPNGAWTQSVLGPEGADPNTWYVSCAENGHTATVCGSGCVAASPTATLATLHLGSNQNSLGDIGAAYDAGGLCGFWTCPQTNRRIESPTINCTGQSTITLAFNYIENGSGTLDDASVWYFNGATWALITNTAATPVNCPGSQGRWTAFSAVLPVSANNNPNVKIGFLWINNDDGVGTDPSFAVDDITLSDPPVSAPPVAAINPSATSICIGSPVNFTDASTGTPTSWAWTFPGGTPASSTSQNVTGVTWAAAGTYTVSLTATNANGNSTATVVITVNPNPVVTAAAAPATICAGQSSTLTGGGASTYVWNPGNLPGSPISVTPAATTTYTVTGTSAAGCTNTAQVTVTVDPLPVVTASASPTTICVGQTTTLTGNGASTYVWNPGNLPGASVIVSPVTTTTYTVTGTSAAGCTNTAQVTIIVNSCPGPIAAFTASATSICIGDSIDFTDASTGGPTSWSWSFPGGTPASSTSQNVTDVYWIVAGTYTVTLTATNGSGSTSATQIITVNPAPNIIVTASPATICVGQNSTLTGAGASTYTWTPGPLSGIPVTVSPAATTTYTVVGTSAAGCTNSAQVTVTVQPCLSPQVDFMANDTVLCVGDCISFTDLTANNPIAWQWTFSGASVSTSSVQNPTNICYPTAGTFAVTLTATNANGTATLTKTGYIVVNPPPVANAGNNASICTGQSTTLVGSGGVSYNWQPGNLSGSSVLVTPPSTTTYTLTVTDANGCTATDLVTITVTTCATPVAALSVSDNTICESSCIDFTDMSTGTPTGWQWSFPGATPATSTAQNPTNICYNTPGTYSVTLISTNAFGSDTVTMTNAVTVGAQPSVNASTFVTIAIGNSTQLTATGGAGSYSWSPPTGLNNSNAQNPVASPTVTTTYTVTYTDNFGCTATDTVTVEVIEAYSIFVPGSFSPNSDGTNDVLFVRGAGIKELTFVVYDRFGEKVFESTSVNDGWDGSFRGKDMNTGIYVWYVTAVFYNATTETLKGDVSLVR